MTSTLPLDQVEFSSLLKPGDCVMWGQACAEPLPLTERLLAQRHTIGRFSVFLGIPAAGTAIRAEHADCVSMRSYCGTGSHRRLIEQGVLDVVPCHYSQLAQRIASGQLRIDVVLLQLSAPNEDGYCSYSAAMEYLQPAVQNARVVIAEINDQAPFTPGSSEIHVNDIHLAVHTSRPLLEQPAAEPGIIEQQIAEQVAQLIDDGDTIQLGIGALPEAILSKLDGHRDLGIHSGTIGDQVARLMQSGVINNQRKSLDPGITVTGLLMGTRSLFEYAHNNPLIRLCPTRYTHGFEILSRQQRLTTINSALEVDLSGQVNAEEVSGRYLGAVGGALDFGRGANAADGGKPIIALGSMARGQSRIVARLSGPVSTPRSDTGIVVTEYGYADLRGLTLTQRIERLIAIAHPDARAALAQQGEQLIKHPH